MSSVGVLVLIDEDVAETAAVLLTHVREPPQQGDGAHDEVVEVQGIRSTKATLVLDIDLSIRSIVSATGILESLIGSDELVLLVRDPVHDRPWLELLRVQILIAGHQGDKSFRVGVVINGEIARDVQTINVGPQHSHRSGMEGRHPHRLGPVTYQIDDARLHLSRSLVGEGDGQNGTGMDTALPHQVRDTTGQDTGLARTSTGHHEDRGPRMQDGLTLGRVEVGQQVDGRDSCRSHRGMRRQDPRLDRVAPLIGRLEERKQIRCRHGGS